MSLALIDYLTDEDLEKLSSDKNLLDGTRKAASDELEQRKLKNDDVH